MAKWDVDKLTCQKCKERSSAATDWRSQSDEVQAAVAAALREAAQAIQGDEMLSPIGAHRVSARILTLIPEDAQAALDRVVAAERERCAKVAEQKAGAGSHAISAAIRKGGE